MYGGRGGGWNQCTFHLQVHAGSGFTHRLAMTKRPDHRLCTSGQSLFENTYNIPFCACCESRLTMSLMLSISDIHFLSFKFWMAKLNWENRVLHKTRESNVSTLGCKKWIRNLSNKGEIGGVTKSIMLLTIYQYRTPLEVSIRTSAIQATWAGSRGASAPRFVFHSLADKHASLIAFDGNNHAMCKTYSFFTRSRLKYT